VNLASTALIFVGGWAGYAIRQGLGIAIPLGFLQFSQAFEREADFLGLQYAYKTGYDPTSFVDFFEKIQSMEKKKPGTLSKVFSSHPMTSSRIKAAQNEIQGILRARPEYVVNTSEFNDVKARLAMLHGRHQVDREATSNRPRLRSKPGTGTRTADDGTASDGASDERPTLKRRPGQ
jgi:predicted Zn-dependent protease